MDKDSLEILVEFSREIKNLIEKEKEAEKRENLYSAVMASERVKAYERIETLFYEKFPELNEYKKV